jgi:hypothetical protein
MREVTLKPNTLALAVSLGTAVLLFTSTGCGKARVPAVAPTPQAMAISNHLAIIATRGEPVTLGQLDRSYAQPSPAQDAGPLYIAAFAALRSSDTGSSSFLTDNQEALPLLIQAANRPLCRYPIALTNGARVLLPHLGKLKTCAALLRQEAVNQAAHGNAEAAATTLLAGIRLARSLDNEPLLLSKRVQIEGLNMACEGLVDSLNRQAFSEAQLVRLMAALQDAEPAIDLHRAVVGERSILVSVFGSSDEGLAEAMAMEGGGAAPMVSLRSYRSEGHLEGDFAFALDFMSNLVAAVALPYPQALEAAASMKVPGFVEATAGRQAFSAVLLPRFSNLAGKGAEALSRIRMTQAVLAVERYRGKHGGALPASLADLSAEWPTGIPTDPFDGQPLRYRKLPTAGYTVWSVGPNRIDDSGSAEEPDGKTPLDVVQTILRN